MDLERIRNNKARVILQFSIPAIIAMVLTSFITVADGFFIGNYVGKEGIAAVNLGLPIIYLFLAVGLMVSVGGAALAGMAMGAREWEKCNRIFNQTIVTTAAAAVCTSLIVFACVRPMLAILRADELVVGHFRNYYGVMLLELPIMVMNSSFGMFVRGEGNPQFYMKVNVLNVLLNMILDYVAAVWLNLGVTGIAAASLISAVVSMLCMVWYFIRRSVIYKFAAFAFSKEILTKTVLNGSSEFIGEMSMSITMFAYNYVIMRQIGTDGVTAFTVVGYVSYVFSMLVVGFGQGASPLMSFTYGAREKELSKKIRSITSLFVFAAGMAVILIMNLASRWYSGLFVKNGEVQQMIRTGMLIFMSSFLFSGINAIASFYFTATGRARESAVISASRGLVVLLICIFTLPALLGMTGVWLAAPVTEGVTLVISIIFLYQDR